MRADMEHLWRYTQDPSLHQAWDLRFSRIDYLPKQSDNEPQRFIYETQIGFGIKVAGEGKSTGEHHKESGERTSALKFWSESSISLIKTGSGYWKYIPRDEGILFLTWYDYKVRFGLLGQWIDKIAFRPLIGWATAWSFDALRLWVEKGLHPSTSKSYVLFSIVANATISFTWLYHGIVPKLLFMESGELNLMEASGITSGNGPLFVYIAGIAEILFGISFWFFGHYRLLHYLNILALVVLGTGAAVIRPAVYTEPFNPATTSFGAIALSIIVLRLISIMPLASRCARTPKQQR